MEFFEKARYEIEGFYEPSQRARDDGVMELSTRNGFCSKANVEEKSFSIQMSNSTKFIFWITFPQLRETQLIFLSQDEGWWDLLAG